MVRPSITTLRMTHADSSKCYKPPINTTTSPPLHSRTMASASLTKPTNPINPNWTIQTKIQIQKPFTTAHATSNSSPKLHFGSQKMFTPLENSLSNNATVK